MARNRRKVEGEVTLSWVITKLMFFVLIVGAVLGVVLLRGQNYRLGQEQRAIEVELASAQKTTLALESQLAALKTPRVLESKMAYYRMNFVRPSETQIRRLQDPMAGSGRVLRPRMLAQTTPQ